MKTVHAIYENGVFRPIEPVDLPDRIEVTFEPRPVNGKSRIETSDDLEPYVGTVKLTEDPLEFQRRIREEWS